jgi:hypothetical protein
MKHTTKKILTFLCIGTIISQNQLSAILTVSQYKPDSFFQAPYFVQDDFTNVSTIFSGGFASQAYNKNGHKVPYLQQFGTETFLKRFTDPSLPNNDTQNFGQGVLDGKFHVREMILSCYKNMDHGFFIEGAVVLQDLTVNNITAQYAPSSIPLTQDQIEYLQDLQLTLPVRIGQSGMFTAAFYGGYSHTFLNFINIDFIDLTIKTGFMAPQAMTNNLDNFVQLPFYGNYNFGYPIIATGSIGVLDWITVGCNASVVPWQTTTKTISLQTSSSDNTLLGMQPGLATIERHPLCVASIYFQADHFHQGASAMIGYSYTKNFDYTITPINTTTFSTEIINGSSLTDGWSFGALYLQLDIDFASHNKPNSPTVAVFCNIPIAGHFCPKTTIFGAACNLQISYKF